MTELVYYYHNPLPNAAFDVLNSAIKLSDSHSIISTFDEFMIDQYVIVDSPTSRIIAIDFDNTITADPNFYMKLVSKYREHNWEPVVCTLRDDLDGNLEEIHDKMHDAGIRVYTTDGKKKRAYMLHEGISVGLWIDDYFPAITQFGTPLLVRNGIVY